MYSPPVLSTPVSGVSLRDKWKFQSSTSTPEDVRKKLFDMADDNEQAHWSSSSEYFSQSLNDESGISQTNMFDECSPGEQGKPQVCIMACLLIFAALLSTKNRVLAIPIKMGTQLMSLYSYRQIYRTCANT